MRTLLALGLAAALFGAGCTASGAGVSNFDLQPAAVGWFAGDEAHFTLNLSKSLLHSAPRFTIDRDFAIEKIQFSEKALAIGGDYTTQNPDDVELRLAQDGANGTKFTLDAEHPSVDLYLKVPASLRDSEYSLELKLFNVGWVKSDKFRVDRR